MNEDIKQVVEVLATDMMKYLWLSNNLSALVDAGEVLIFANQKARVDEITSKLIESGKQLIFINICFFLILE